MSDEIKIVDETEKTNELADIDTENSEENLVEATQNLLNIDKATQVQMMTAHLRNARSIEALASSHIAMTSVVLHMAEQLQVQLPVMKVDVNTGETSIIRVNISKEGSYDAKEMPQIIALLKVAVDRSASQIRNAKAMSDAAEEKVHALQRDLAESRELIRKLRVVVRHPTIDEKPFVVCLH